MCNVNSYSLVCSVWVGLILIFLGPRVGAQDERVRYFPRHIESPKKLPEKEKTWIFILAGQSNMAGRGLVAPEDTLPHPQILSINRYNEIIVAKEPLHFYEPNLTGLDCGVSFAREIMKHQPSITILLIPTAVGGSSSNQWLGDSLHRGVKLLTNFRERVEQAKKYGTIKGILWHQGEADTEPGLIQGYEDRLQKLFTRLRSYCGNATLPIVIGELGSFSQNQANWNMINKSIHRYASKNMNAFVVDTKDLKSKEDKIHFDSKGQRTMGRRMAEKFLQATK
ncbi:MAG TPA: sialate O-acetylesterase [Chryseolinea sp.]|nr:sialate O-acetylesterase [Chryseolinea sp.]